MAAIPDASVHLLQRLRERMAELPAAQRSVVQCVLDDPRAAVAATVEQLAQQAGVSMPTIVRTCRSFGFESVREFMLALAQDLAVTGSYLHRSVLADDSAGDVASKIIHAAVSSLTELGRRLDVDVLDRVASRLAEARRIDCYSVGAASTFMANELQSRLFRLGRTSNAIFDAHQQLVSASTLGPDGVAFVISHVGRMPYTLEAARFARSQGATVVALTQPDTQLAEIADLVIAVSVPQDAVMRVGTEAYLAHLVVIEILMVRLAQKLGPVATRGLQQFKQLLHKHGFDSAEFSGASETLDDPSS
ncbi:MurR/RpiR family transcriptional regulator [Variovorax saccharolyticus]|uniref:MurR/RpiR family transcriptional regulator n=1 Tax=Variovorax saccharolyticus TaxID=3053516 RepID=UPI002574B337|nr:MULTISPECIES: MurR/RpiR family transcriptional regulator [unclassified Variovorax]MDM0022604.1 MurR/RpiR family transcriptional regulator [Variovorax sp. J22R187]MDM0028552.1 MurR/RpiR family transcriptional regulator [Variovorax sp. J31P216]